MQPLSLAALGPEARRLIEDFRNVPTPDFAREGAFMAGISIALAVLVVWLASQLFAKDRASVLRAVQTNLLWLVSLFAVVLLTGFAFVIASHQGSAILATAILVIGGVLTLYVWISVPMRIYKITILPALGFVIVAGILHSAGQIAVGRLLGDRLQMRAYTELATRFSQLPPAEASGVVAALRQPAAYRRGGGPSIAARQAELRKIYIELQARRELLREGDQQSLDDYNRDNARYIELLGELQRDAAAERK